MTIEPLLWMFAGVCFSRSDYLSDMACVRISRIAERTVSRMPTLEEAIGTFEQLSKLCETNGIHDSQELYKQYAAWLRELQDRRKAPEIIYCKDCKAIYCNFCLKTLRPVEKEKDYCSWSERRPDVDT